MDKIFDFIDHNREVSVATVDRQGLPAVRIFQVMKVDKAGKKLYFATSMEKEIYKQLIRNPYMEVLAYSNNISVRISGEVSFQIPDKVARDIFDENSILQKLYRNYTDVVYFELKINRVFYYNLNHLPPVTNEFIFNAADRMSGPDI